MKRTILTKCIKPAAFMLCCMAVLFSCNEDIYDNVKEYAKEEAVYPAHFDTIYGHIGFERVEIDLCKAGRVPASQMKLGKAERTIVEFTKSGKDTVIIYDSVCSWINITGLTEANIYRFRVYTDNGIPGDTAVYDKSVPMEISLIPYTRLDRDAMSLPEPSVMSSTSSAQVQWKSSLSSEMGDIISWRYEYVDSRNDTIRNGDVNDTPSFFIENVTADIVMVNIYAEIIPRVDYRRIIDTLELLFPVKVNMEGTEPVIFLDRPYLNEVIRSDTGRVFSWARVSEVSSYVLKLSPSNEFPDDKTTSILVGDDNQIHLTSEELDKHGWPAYWTVVPETPDDRIRTQNRKYYRHIDVAAEMKDNYVNLTKIKYANEKDDKTGKELRKLEKLRQITVEGLVMPVSGFGKLHTFFGVEGYFLIRFGDGTLNREYVQLATNRGGYPPNNNDVDHQTIKITPPEEGSKWHHIAITYDVDAKVAEFYQNGVKVHELRDGDLVGDYFNEGIRFYDRDVQIGRAGGYNDRKFSGNMAEVRLWETIRTQEELASNMYDVDPETPGLLGYWKFNENFGKTINDYSGNGFTQDAKNDVVWRQD